MDSYQVLKQAVEKVGAKRVAADMKLSASLVYKWCQPSTAHASAEVLSGARNPLDRVKALLVSTGDPGVVQWLCEQAGGFFVRDPDLNGARVDAEYIAHTQGLIEDFSNLLRVVSDAIADDGQVDARESRKIRTEWQRLKQYGEGFVCACERGLFAGTVRPC